MKKVYGVLSAGFLFCNLLSAQDLQFVTQNGNTTDRQIVVHRTDGSYGLNVSNSDDADLLLGTSVLGASIKYAWMQSSLGGRHLVLNPDNGGNVGVGIISPTSKLDVNGDMQIRPAATPWGEGLTFTMPVIQKWGGLRWRREKTNYDGNWALGYTGLDATDDLVVAANNNGTQVNDILRLTKNGNVGIGTSTPSYKLQVSGNSRIDGNFTVNNNIFAEQAIQCNNTEGIRLKNNGGFISGYNNENTIRTGYLQFLFGGAVTLAGEGYSGIQLATGGSPRLTVNYDGTVGIGTTNPGTYKLAVEGTVGARKVKVTQETPWADYVFDSSYQLKPLNQVEQFIQENKHLPEIPTAAEVKKEGIDLGDNQVLLLKKIEELTLYIIQQNKRIEALEKQQKEAKVGN